ncbi:MAG TPA: SRPBCC domain-containing protein [Trueperaceae bacterium]|nr:SRPBCC domain-containing protein [Trueperaceae bacterium]
MTSNKMFTQVEGNTVILEREFDAPRERVFEAFTDCKHLKHWWGPRGWDLPVCKMDFREGGSWLYCMKCVDESMGEFYGMESWGKAVYGAIDAPNRIEYTDYFVDAEGTINADLPATDAVTEFIEVGGRTKVISRSSYATPEQVKTVLDMGMLEGVTQTWDRLAEHLATVRA